jgi:predicted CXXCH cytochrome family protein
MSGAARILPWIAGVLLAGSVQAQPPVSPGRCVECHLEQTEERLAAPARKFAEDVHGRAGFDCLACHGSPRAGEPEHVSSGFLGAPDRRAIALICGRCHSDAAFMRDFNPSLRVDQVQEYMTSGHGRGLMERNDPNVATCIDCHPPHQIRPPSDLESSVHPLKVAETCGVCHADEELMRPYEHSPAVLDDYRAGVHGRLLLEEGDVSAPTCNDCHGNHGAAPPGVGSVRNVCGQCHTVMADFFAQSAHVAPFEEQDLPGCVTCHGHHLIAETADSLLVVRSGEICADCHSAGDRLGGEFLAMKGMIDSLQAAYAASRVLLDDAEDRGMEVSQALFELEEVNNALTKARSAIHSFHVEPVQQEVDAGLVVAAAGSQRGRVAMREWYERRLGLAASTLFIVVLIAAIIGRIRVLEHGHAQRGERAGHEPSASQRRKM